MECVCAQLLGCLQLFATPWTIACQAPLSMEFSRQEYWSGLPFPSPGDLPDPVIEPRSPTLQADALTSEPPGKPYMILPLLGIYLMEVKTSIRKDICTSRFIAALFTIARKFKQLKCQIRVLRKGGKNTQKNCTKKIFMTQIITVV